jgi:PAS domain-containing protein
MTHTPCPAGHQASLALRLSEAALESSGWHAVAEALQAEAGPGFALRFQAEGTTGGASPTGSTGRAVLRVTGLGTWIVDLPDGPGGALALAVPLRESLALALRLREGLPPSRAELEAVLDPLPYAAVLLDDEGRLLFANAAGEDVLASRRLIRPARRGARLRPTRRKADEALDEALTRILDESDPGARWVVRGPDGLHLVIHARPVGPAAAERGAARVLITLRAIGAARGLPG